MSRSDKTIKDRALAIIRELPEGSSYEDILRALRFERMIERGLADSVAGRMISSEEMQRRIESWAPDERDDDPTSRQPSIVELLGMPADAGDVELPDGNVEAMWRREVAARIEALDAGEVTMVPWEEIRARLLARLEEKRSK